MKKALPTIIAITLLSTVFTLNYQADIALVPGSEIRDNLIEINITVLDDHTDIEIRNSFTLASHLDDIFVSSIQLENGTFGNVEIISPEYAILEMDGDQIHIGFNTIENSYEQIQVEYITSISLENKEAIRLIRGIDSVGFYELWTSYYLGMEEFDLNISSNVNMTGYLGEEEITGDELSVKWNYRDPIFGHEPYSYLFMHDMKYFSIDVSWGDRSNMATITETSFSNITEEHYRDIPGLIQEENIQIVLSDSDEGYSYQLIGDFIINREIISHYNPVSLWFPMNGTEANATLSFEQETWMYEDGEETSGVNEVKIILEVETANKFGQRGFYIYIPELEEEWDPILSEPILHVEISGQEDENWFDFVIVTKPINDSEISILYPSIFNIKVATNPFENSRFENGTFKNELIIFGACLEVEALHVTWDHFIDTDGDTVPDHQDDYPHDDQKWLKEEGSSWTPWYVFLIIILSVISIVFLWWVFRSKRDSIEMNKK